MSNPPPTDAPAGVYKTVFVGTDFSPPAAGAIAFAQVFLQNSKATVNILHNCPAVSLLGPSEEDRNKYEHDAQTKLKAACEAFEQATPVTTSGDNPATTLVDAAKEGGADLCLVGTAGRTGLSRLIIGSVAENVVRHAHCDVLTVPPSDDAPQRPERVLVATDLSPASIHAVRRALAVSRFHQATLRIIHVYDPSFPIPNEEGQLMAESERAQAEFASLNEGIDALGEDFIDLDRAVHSSSSPADGVIDAADEFNADLVVLGSHGRTGLGRFLIGSVAERTVRGAGRPVLVVRPAS